MECTEAGRRIGWITLVVIGFWNIAGYVWDMYQLFWWFDRVLHGVTVFGITLWFGLFIFARALRFEQRMLAAVLLASGGLALGALWEVAEWVFDRYTTTNMIKGKDDTVLDIVMDTIGAMVGAIVAVGFLRPIDHA